MRKPLQALLAAAFASLAAPPAAALPQVFAPGPEEGAARPTRAELAVELGGGAWLGDFREHLDRDGAYLLTPALDFTARFPMTGLIGVEALVGSDCVIHRYSEPIDGSFLYQEAGLYAGIPIGRAYAWIAGEAGFEHGTLRVTEYSSGVAGAALGVSIPAGGRLSWVATLRFRRGFLQAVTVPAAYGTGAIDHPTSLTLTAGVAYGL
jgi:hypothetical protein